MDRLAVERRLCEYIAVLDRAASETEFTEAEVAYRAPAHTAKRLLARWQGGESEENFKAALKLKLPLYRANPPPGREAELVGRAFGDLWQTVGLDLGFQ